MICESALCGNSLFNTCIGNSHGDAISSGKRYFIKTKVKWNTLA